MAANGILLPSNSTRQLKSCRAQPHSVIYDVATALHSTFLCLALKSLLIWVAKTSPIVYASIFQIHIKTNHDL
jgi:hypothetical protein